MELNELQEKGPESPLRYLKAQGLKPVKVGDGLYQVPSGTKPGTSYTVDAIDRSCTCRDFEIRGGPCKHVIAVDLFMKAQPETKEPKKRVQATYLGCDSMAEIEEKAPSFEKGIPDSAYAELY